MIATGLNVEPHAPNENPAMLISTTSATTLAFGMPGGWEWIFILAIGLLIFGRRLPEVGRSLGKGIVEFKRGIKGIDDEIREASDSPAQKPQLDQSSPQEFSKYDANTGGEKSPYTNEPATGEKND